MNSTAPPDLKLTVTLDGQRSEHDFAASPVRVGRAPDNELHLPDRGVSRYHCRLEREGAQWVLIDLGSQNGTLVGGERVSRRVLGAGDVIQVGRARLTCSGADLAHGDAPSPPRALDDTATGLSAAQLRASARPRQGLHALLRINKALASELEPRALLESIVDSALELTGGERGFLVLARESGGWSFEVARNFAGEIPEAKFSETIAEQVRSTGRSVLTVNAQDDLRFSALASVVDLRLRSVLCTPLELEGQVVGLLYLDNRLQAGAFGEQDVELLEALAAQAAVALRNARLVQELRALNARLAERADRSESRLTGVERELRIAKVDVVARRFPGIVGEAPAMLELYRTLERFITSDYPVLIQGESGTGKELIARSIHARGARASKAFISENCAALPDELLESELFGHAKGAFTGAHRAKRGLLEQADGGTLFLDEVSEMSPQMQKKLLRVLQEGELRPLGSDRLVRVDVRLVSASNRDLEAMVRAGEFREDLLYRLRVLPVRVPPLRERRSDVSLLIDCFLETFCRESARARPRLAPEVLQRCEAYGWPGNVRQLQNEVRKWVVLAGPVVELEHLSAPLLAEDVGDDEEEGERGDLALGLPERVAALEQRAIRRALRSHGGNKSRAAQELGISRFALQRKLEKLGLEGEASDRD
jgi:serine/threonine-protein kinase PknK